MMLSKRPIVAFRLKTMYFRVPLFSARQYENRIFLIKSKLSKQHLSVFTKVLRELLEETLKIRKRPIVAYRL